MLGCTLIL